MARIDGIYVTVKGDISDVQTKLEQLRKDTKRAGQEISDSLNGAVSAGGAQRALNDVAGSVGKLSAAAYATKDALTGMGVNMDGLGKALGLSNAQLAAFQERALQTRATQEAERAFQTLTKAIGATGPEIDALRAQFGLAEQASGKLGSSFSSLMNVAKGLAVTIGAIEVAGFAKDVVMAAARFDTLGVVIRTVGVNSGHTSSEMMSLADGIKRQGISALESRESLAKMAASQLDLSKASQLARIAQDAAVIANRNSSETFGLMIQAITTGQSILLHHMGIMTDFEHAYVKAGAAMGTSKDALTDHEKAQIRLNIVLDEGAKRQGVYEAAMETAGKRVLSFQRYIDDLKVAMGEPFQQSFMNVIKLAEDLVAKMTQFAQSDAGKTMFRDIGQLAEAAAIGIAKAGEGLGTVIGTIATIASEWDNLPDIIKQLGIFGAVAFGVEGMAALGLFAVANAQLKNFMSAAKASFGDLQSQLDILKQQESGLGSSATPDQKAYIQREKSRLGYLIAAQKASGGTVGTGGIPTPYAEQVESAMAKITRDKSQAIKDSEAASKERNDLMGNMPYDVQYQNIYAPLQGKLTRKADDWVAAYNAQNWDKVRAINDSVFAMTREAAKAEEALNKEFDPNKGQKGGAAKYGERGQAMLADAMAQAKSLQDSLTGGLEANSDKVDKFYTTYAGRVKVAMTEAKGDVGGYVETLRRLGISFDENGNPVPTAGGQWEQAQSDAGVKDYSKRLDREAKQLSDFAKYSGDIEAKMLAERRSAEAKYAEESISSDATIKAQALSKFQAFLDQEGEARAKALGEAGKLTTAYWQAEDMHLTQRVASLKAAGASEVAIATYVAQEKTRIAKEKLETEIKYTDSFSTYLADRLALDYGLYKDAASRQRDMWEGYYSAIKKGFDSVEKAIGDGLTSILTDAFQGNLKNSQDYFKSFVDSIKSMFAQLLSDLIRVALRNYIIIPIMGQFVGTLGGGQGGGVLSSLTGGNSNGLSNLLSLSKGDNGIFSGATSWVDALGTKLGFASPSGAQATALATSPGAGIEESMAAGNQIMAGNAGGFFSKTLSAYLGPLFMGAGIGNMLGGMMWSNGSGTFGSTLGGAAGGLIGSMILPGIGTVIGSMIGGGLGGLTGHETRDTRMTGTGLVARVEDGKLIPAGFSSWNTKVSGMGGDWNEHTTMPYNLDNATYKAMMSDYNALKRAATDAADSMGLSTESLKNFNTQLLANGGAGNDYSTIMKAVGEAMAENILRANGYTDALDGVLRPGESFATALTRLAGDFANVDRASRIAGLSVEKLSGSVDKMGQIAYASKLTEVMGGADQVNAAFNTFTRHTLSSPELAQNTINFLADQAGTALAALPKNLHSQVGVMANMLPGYDPINSSTSALDPSNFWAQYQQAMSGTMTPEDFKLWATAGAAMDSLSSAVDQAAVSASSAASAYNAAAQQTASAMDSVIKSTSAARYSIMASEATSPLSAKDRLAFAQNAYDEMLSKASGGDQDAMAQLASQGQALLQVNEEVNAHTAAYYEIQQHVYDTLGEIQSQAQSAYDAALSQINATNATTAAVTAQTTMMTDALERVRQAILTKNQSVQNQATTGTNPTDTGPSNGTQTTTTTTTTNPGGWSLPGGGTTTNPVEAMAFNSFTGLSLDNYSFGDSTFAHFADGGFAMPGWAIVGERGPELVNFANPGRVYTAKETSQALRQKSDNSDVVGALGAVGSAIVGRLSSLEKQFKGVQAKLDRVVAAQ